MFQRSERCCWTPIYLQRPVKPGARKNVEPMAEQMCARQRQQLHHLVSTSSWSNATPEQVLRKTAEALAGRKDAALIVDNTALRTQGKHSVGGKR